MSALSELDALILREAVHPPLITKNAELTFAEWDAHVTAMYDAIQSIVSGDNVTPYNPLTVYNAASTDVYLKFAGYDSRIWEAIGTFSDVTPTEGVNWTQVTMSELLPDVLKLAQISAGETGCICMKSAVQQIPSANILTSYDTPVLLNLPRVAGETLVVIKVVVNVDFNTVAYATNTTLGIRFVGADVDILTCDILARTIIGAKEFVIVTTVGDAQTQLIDDADIEVYTKSGNPTAGDSAVKISVVYFVA